MIEEGRIIGVGFPYVEGKIKSSHLRLPQLSTELSVYLDLHSEADLYAGGSIPNIVTSLVRLTNNSNIRLFSCVGDDSRGKFYMQNMDQRIGAPAVSAENPTGVWVGIYQDGLIEGRDFYGAALDLDVSQDELRSLKNNILITDADACIISKTRDQVQKAIEAVEEEGLFALSLVGVREREDISQLLSFTNKIPDAIFGNVHELNTLTGISDSEQAIREISPETKIVVITQAEKGAMIRFNNYIFDVPAYTVSEDNIIDETGAGDTFMGTMLALLLSTASRQWTEIDVRKAAGVASYASAEVIQSMHSRLTSTMASDVRRYATNF